eukprot:TRINITY_DN16601_c0_g1_i6.p1 TRINITY_DN16601_c0_g1~~TRINITY_DN16601_c0_g1_i6.p1  ORF type:complete len:299 (-),score=50.06 TRINITY_DN16601_c0_g1_i6:78-974(-)
MVYSSRAKKAEVGGSCVREVKGDAGSGKGGGRSEVGGSRETESIRAIGEERNDLEEDKEVFSKENTDEESKFTSKESKDLYETERKHYASEEEPSTTVTKQDSAKKKPSRLVITKAPSEFTQPIAYRSLPRCNSVAALTRPSTASKPKAPVSEYGVCTDFTLNLLEPSHVSNISVGNVDRLVNKRLKSVAKENKPGNSMINKEEKENYKVIMNASIKRRNKDNCPIIPINKFKQSFYERLKSINNTLSQRHISELEYHKREMRRVPEGMSTPRVRLLREWTRELVSRQEEVFYQSCSA